MKSKLKLSLLAAMGIMLPLSTLSAATEIWNGTTSNDLTNPLNWTTTTPTAGNSGSFGVAATTNLNYGGGSISNTFTADGLSFTSPNYDITINGNETVSRTFNIVGAGVVNTSGSITPINAINGARINFTNGSSAQTPASTSTMRYSADGDNSAFPSIITFANTSTAGASLILIGNITTAANAAFGVFSDTSDAQTAELDLDKGGSLSFNDTSTANAAAININPNGVSTTGTTSLFFNDGSDPASSIITSINSGSTTFDTTTNVTTATVSLDTGSILNVNQDIELTQLTSASATDVIHLNGADLTINNAILSAQTIVGQITGNGVLIKDGIFGLELTNTTNNYTGGTNILAGAIIASTNSLPGTHLPTAVSITTGANLNFEDTTSGTFAGNIVNDGTVRYFGNASSTISGNISGNGNLIVGTGMTPGQLTLTGTNSYIGGTQVSDGFTLVGTTNSLQGTIGIDASTLTFDQASNGTFIGTITSTDNTAILNKNGTGTVTFNTPNPLFLGTTNVNAGTLNLNALLGGNVNVLSTGILSGIGTVGGNLTVNGGIAPGNSIGTLNVAGNYVQNAGSTYFLEINGLGQSDLIDVTGTATLNGGQVVITSLDGAALSNTPYTILTADGGLAGQFASVSTTNLLLTPTLIYDANNAYVVFAQTTFTFDAVTPNQIAVATQLESITDPTPEEFLILSTLAALPAEQQQLALDEMSGVQYASLNLISEIASRQFIRRLYDPLRSIVTTEPCNDCCYECPCPTLDLWFEAGGGQTFLDGNSNAHGLKLNGWEITAGVQSTFNCDWTVGIAGSYVEDCIKHDLRGSGKNRMGFGAIYGLYRPSNFYVLADLGFGGGEFTVNRSIDIGVLSYTAKGNPKHYHAIGYIEAGFDWNTCNFLVQPFLGFEGGYFRRNSFSETGTSPLNLNVNKQTYGNAFSRLGVHLTTEQWSALKLSVDVAWDCRLTSNKASITESFQDFGVPFVITGVARNRNSVDAAATITTKLCGGWELYAEVGGEFWSKVSTYNVLGGVKYSW